MLCIQQLVTFVLGAALVLSFSSGVAATETTESVAKSWRDVTPQPQFLAAVYGMAGCFNVPAAETVLPDQKGTLETRCNVVEDPDNSGAYVTSAASFPTNPFVQQQLPEWLRSDRPENFYLDALPVTLSLPCESDHPGHEFFQITTNKGREVTSLFSNAAPANEPNELNTIALAGHFGDGVNGTEWPVKVTIVGDVILKDYFTGDRINANGMTASVEDFPDMEYMNADAAPHLLQAIIEPLDSDVMAGETSTDGLMMSGVYPNHCRAIWGDTVTHRIRVLMSGGASLDGVTQVRPTDEVFKVVKESGEELDFGADEVFVGLADLGNSKTERTSDGDNYFDLCLADPSEAVVHDIGQVRMPCDTIKLYYPRGSGASVNNGTAIWSGCVNSIIDVIHSPKMTSSSVTEDDTQPEDDDTQPEDDVRAGSSETASGSRPSRMVVAMVSAVLVMLLA